jgi:hypothetical protein
VVQLLAARGVIVVANDVDHRGSRVDTRAAGHFPRERWSRLGPAQGLFTAIVGAVPARGWIASWNAAWSASAAYAAPERRDPSGSAEAADGEGAADAADAMSRAV